jgi:hypothetical protein
MTGLSSCTQAVGLRWVSGTLAQSPAMLLNSSNPTAVSLENEDGSNSNRSTK